MQQPLDLLGVERSSIVFMNLMFIIRASLALLQWQDLTISEE